LLIIKDEDAELYQKYYPIFNTYNAKFKTRIGTEDEPSDSDQERMMKDSVLNSLEGYSELEELLNQAE